VDGKTVLDIASGEGFGAWFLAQRAAHVIGVDISQESVAHASVRYRHPRLEFRHGDCRAIPLEDDSVDFVVSFETLEHIREHAEFLAEVQRVLKPGGVLLISTPEVDGYADGRTQPNEYHALELSRQEFATLLQAHFANVALYDQGIKLASVIWPRPLGTEAAAKGFGLQENPWWREVKEGACQERDLHDAVIAIAAASDSPIEDLGLGGFLQSFPHQFPFSAMQGGLADRIREAQEEAQTVGTNKLAAAELRHASAEREAAAQIARLEHANGVLTRAGALMAEDLRRTAARPWRPLKRAAQRGVLKFALLFRGLLSDRAVARLSRSLAKRKPRRFSFAWGATLAQAWGTEAPVDPLVAPVTQGADVPIRARLAHDLLLGLATVSAPFSKRRAEKFRRSAAKRDPFRFRADPSAERINVPFLAGRISASPVADPDRARRILVADYRIPRPDLSAGEKATFGLIADLRAIGFEVTFVPTDMTDAPPYRKALEALGVSVITGESGYSSGGNYIRSEGARFGVFYFIRVDVAEALIQSARLVAPDAPMIFHAPDLYFLRESRGAEMSGDPAEMLAANRTRAREAAIMQASDHVVLVSPAEIPFLTDILPRSRISVFPALYSPVVATLAGHAARRHIFFLGGFKHPPNVDAVKWFVKKVWPAVHARLPGVEFHIVGAEAPADVIALGEQPGVRFVGYVQDLDPILAGYRLSVAPLLYGAGIKGKLGAAMGAGVPCVSTTIGAEGMGIVDGLHAMVRDDAEGFAEAVVSLYGDPALWQSISEKGRQLVEDRFGDAANQSAFCRVLDDAGALPLDMYVAWCQAAEPAPLPAPDTAEPVDVSIIVPVHNQWHFTRSCLISVLRAMRGTGITCEVILADDASTDETLQAASLFPGLRVVRQDRNLGFLGNCNAAAAEARGEALLFLNNDTIVLPGWLTELVRVLREEPSAAIVGSKLLYPDGSIQDSGGVIFSDGSAANLGRGKLRGDALFGSDREVDYATGASILVRGSFWDKVGGFDGRFSPAYCEDSDLSMSARLHGMKVILAANSIVVHFEHGSYGEQLKSKPQELQRINSEKLREKWHPVLTRDHLAPGTLNEIAAAHAQRTPLSRDRTEKDA